MVINRTEQILSRLRAGGKVQPIAIGELSSINKHMEEVRREYLVKAHQSELAASKFILTA